MILNGECVEVVVEKKRIKNVYFRINEEGQVYVTCPMLCSEREIKRLIEKNKDSLEKMYKKASKRNDSNNKVLLLGNELEFIESKKIKFEGNKAYGPSVEAVNLYLEKHALKVFQDRMDIYMPTYNNLPKFRLRMRKMKSRWGVCNKSSWTVTLNTLLIHKKIYLIDYVICHELSHFEHMDHSKEFWKDVEAHFPKYKQARKELRD